MKIYIAFDIMDEATGGGNQFLKALKKYLQSIGVYQDDVSKADIVLFNSHQLVENIAKLKYRYPDKIFVHRIDGPMKLYNTPKDKRDNIVLIANKYLAEAAIFQSEWSRLQNYQMGLEHKLVETVIRNAPDPSIFSRENKIVFSKNRKIKLISTSWSTNQKKGFDTYQWLDEHLDFGKYEMCFVGNSPVKFRNIKHILPMSSYALAAELKNSDIFITASQKDPCSNSLIEALHCGLPAVALKDGGHPEIIGTAGELFTSPQEIPLLLDTIAENYQQYQDNIHNPSMEQVGQAYFAFMRKVYEQKPQKKFGRLNYLCLIAKVLFWKIAGKVQCL